MEEGKKGVKSMERDKFVCTGCGEVFDSQEITEHELFCIDFLGEMYEDEVELLLEYIYEDEE